LITNKKKLNLLDIININRKGIKRKIKKAIAPSLPYVAPPLATMKTMDKEILHLRRFMALSMVSLPIKI
jgi:hypothetical protein